VAHVLGALPPRVLALEAEALLGDDGRAAHAAGGAAAEGRLVPEPAGPVGCFVAVEAGAAVEGEGVEVGTSVNDVAGP
jgi:hypothetical protein